ncbi:mycofactocin precursor MftA [Streptomyces sp. GC420]|nr:mycofactocin precursor MftA [Streptomyces sp. GC420]
MRDEIRDVERHIDTPQTVTAEDLTEEVLVEEVSIDGMCGVY